MVWSDYVATVCIVSLRWQQGECPLQILDIIPQTPNTKHNILDTETQKILCNPQHFQPQLMRKGPV